MLRDKLPKPVEYGVQRLIEYELQRWQIRQRFPLAEFLFCSIMGSKWFDKVAGEQNFGSGELNLDLAAQFHHAVGGQAEKFHCICCITQHPCENFLTPQRHARCL